MDKRDVNFSTMRMALTDGKELGRSTAYTEHQSVGQMIWVLRARYRDDGTEASLLRLIWSLAQGMYDVLAGRHRFYTEGLATGHPSMLVDCARQFLVEIDTVIACYAGVHYGGNLDEVDSKHEGMILPDEVVHDVTFRLLQRASTLLSSDEQQPTAFVRFDLSAPPDKFSNARTYTACPFDTARFHAVFASRMAQLAGWAKTIAKLCSSPVRDTPSGRRQHISLVHQMVRCAVVASRKTRGMSRTWKPYSDVICDRPSSPWPAYTTYEDDAWSMYVVGGKGEDVLARVPTSVASKLRSCRKDLFLRGLVSDKVQDAELASPPPPPGINVEPVQQKQTRAQRRAAARSSAAVPPASSTDAKTSSDATVSVTVPRPTHCITQAQGVWAWECQSIGEKGWSRTCEAACIDALHALLGQKKKLSSAASILLGLQEDRLHAEMLDGRLGGAFKMCMRLVFPDAKIKLAPVPGAVELWTNPSGKAFQNAQRPLPAMLAIMRSHLTSPRDFDAAFNAVLDMADDAAAGHNVHLPSGVWWSSAALVFGAWMQQTQHTASDPIEGTLHHIPLWDLLPQNSGGDSPLSITTFDTASAAVDEKAPPDPPTAKR